MAIQLQPLSAQEGDFGMQRSPPGLEHLEAMDKLVIVAEGYGEYNIIDSSHQPRYTVNFHGDPMCSHEYTAEIKDMTGTFAMSSKAELGCCFLCQLCCTTVRVVLIGDSLWWSYWVPSTGHERVQRNIDGFIQ